MDIRNDTTIIVPQFGRPELTANTIRSFREHHGSAAVMIVVDDGGPVQAIHDLRVQLANEAILLRLPKNCGVTAAWNAGTDQARTEFLVFLNNDTVTQGTWLSQLIAPLLSGEFQMTGARWRTASEVPSELGVTHLLQGWCLAIRRECFLQLGKFDERFRLYFSDADLQLKCLQRYPGSVQAILGLAIQHIGKATTSRQTNRFFQKAVDRARFSSRWKAERP